MNKGIVVQLSVSRLEAPKGIKMIQMDENLLVKAVSVAPDVAAIAFASNGSIVWLRLTTALPARRKNSPNEREGPFGLQES